MDLENLKDLLDITCDVCTGIINMETKANGRFLHNYVVLKSAIGAFKNISVELSYMIGKDKVYSVKVSNVIKLDEVSSDIKKLTAHIYKEVWLHHNSIIEAISNYGTK